MCLCLGNVNEVKIKRSVTLERLLEDFDNQASAEPPEYVPPAYNQFFSFEWDLFDGPDTYFAAKPTTEDSSHPDAPNVHLFLFNTIVPYRTNFEPPFNFSAIYFQRGQSHSSRRIDNRDYHSYNFYFNYYHYDHHYHYRKAKHKCSHSFIL